MGDALRMIDCTLYGYDSAVRFGAWLIFAGLLCVAVAILARRKGGRA